MQFEIKEIDNGPTYISWNIIDKNKICFNDILILNNYDARSDTILTPKVNLYYSENEFDKYRRLMIDFLDSIRNNNKIFRFYKPSEDFSNMIEFILNDIFKYNFKKYNSLELVLTGCYQFTDEGYFFDNNLIKNCGCQNIPSDFNLYKEYEEVDSDTNENIIYSKYPFEFTFYEIID